MYQITSMDCCNGRNCEKCLFYGNNGPEFQFGKRGTDFHTINFPIGLTLNPTETVLYICDIRSSRIQVFSVDGYFMTSFRSDYLHKPCGITMYRNKLYVTDVKVHSLLRFGNYGVKTTGRCGIRIGELQFPRSVTCDSNGDVYVTDTGNLRIVMYTGQLEVKMIVWSEKSWSPIESRIFQGDIIVLSQYSPYIRCVNLVDKSVRTVSGVDKNLISPSFFSVDKFGNFVINDAGNKKLVITNSRGELLKLIGDVDSSLSMFGIQVTSFNQIIVALSSGTHSISVYKYWLSQIGTLTP